MKFVRFLTPQDKNLNEQELIFSTYEFSRLGQFNLAEGLASLKNLKNLNKKVIFDWDILVGEDEFPTLIELFKTIDLSLFDGIRVQDAGVLQYVLQYCDLPVQLVLEAGNRNLVGIEKWIELVGSRLDRLILSPELAIDDLKRIREKINCPLEILVFGRILLFYSPRKLVSPQFGASDKEHAEVIGKSEESPHKGFSIIENRHGTFMFNPKGLNLLSYLDDIKELGIDYCRIDNRGLSDLEQELIGQQKFDELVENFSKPLIKGFFHKNKTDVLFKKLKNQKLLIRDQSYIGNIVDVIKNRQLALHINNKERAVEVGDELVLITPEGKKKEFSITNLKDLSGQSISQKKGEGIVLIPYPANLSVKTAVYWKDCFPGDQV